MKKDKKFTGISAFSRLMAFMLSFVLLLAACGSADETKRRGSYSESEEEEKKEKDSDGKDWYQVKIPYEEWELTGYIAATMSKRASCRTSVNCTVSVPNYSNSHMDGVYSTSP